MEPVTDTTMAVHSSLCSLIRTSKSLAYYGVFDEHVCKNSGKVCGINGVTYNSECEAMSGKLLCLYISIAIFNFARKSGENA
jgi:hypothetical protein